MRKGTLPDRFAPWLFANACEFLAGRFEGERPWQTNSIPAMSVSSRGLYDVVAVGDRGAARRGRAVCK